MSAPDANRDLLISYTTLRKIVGILGIALPVVLLFGNICFGDCTGPQRSISHNYHTVMGDVFVGMLCAISLFLFVYKGPEPIDGILGNVAGVLGILVAIIPCGPHDTDKGFIVRGLPEGYAWGMAHNIIAGIFLLVLAYFSSKLFTKSREGESPTPEKRKRNVIYKICGWIIVVCVAGCIVVMVLTKDAEPEPEWVLGMAPIFWLETIALWAFGFSWLVKGETLWKDK
jgi:hypothetical protein